MLGFLTILRDELVNDPWQMLLPPTRFIPFISAIPAATPILFRSIRVR